MIDFASATWNDLRRMLERDLDAARKRNDSSDLDVLQTAALRGEIRTLKKILDLPAQATRAVATDPGE